MVRDFIKEHVPAVAALAITIVVAVVCLCLTNHWSNEKEAALSNVDEAKAVLEMEKDKAKEAERAALVRATGIDMGRVDSDTRRLSDMFDRSLTWDSYETYNEARSVLTDEFGVLGDSWLLQEFMPEVEMGTDSDGNEVNVIDSHGYNLYMKDIDVRCIGYSGDKYDYLVHFEAASVYHGSEGLSKGVAMVTTDGNGKIVSADAMEVAR